MDEHAQIIEAGGLDHIELTADIVSAYVSNNRVQPGEMPALIATTHAALAGLAAGGTPTPPTVEKLTPAQIRKSITHETLISFEDGKPYKTLKRHLTLRALSPEAYREKWGLPKDYPMTAAAYSEARSKLAVALGLGQQRKKASPAPAAETETPKRVGRPRKVKEAAEA